MIKTILVPATGSDTDEARLHIGFDGGPGIRRASYRSARPVVENPAQARSARRGNVYRETNNVEQLTPSSVTRRAAPPQSGDNSASPTKL